MKLIYVWDALCGWCYGFEAVLKPFAENHPELELEVISGGLFNQGKTLADYPHIPGANRQIQDIYGVEIGEAYQALLQEGSLVLDSYPPAAGFGVLREMVPAGRLVDLTIALQQALYIDGRSLSDIAVYRDLARQFQADENLAVGQIRQAFDKKDRHHPDFDKTRALNVRSYPTLLLEKDGRRCDLKGSSMTLEELEQNFAAVKNTVA